MTQAVDNLKREREVLQKEKKELTRKLKQAERKKNRLKSKAKMLSTTDILDVIVMRQRAKASASESTTRKAK